MRCSTISMNVNKMAQHIQKKNVSNDRPTSWLKGAEMMKRTRNGGAIVVSFWTQIFVKYSISLSYGRSIEIQNPMWIEHFINGFYFKIMTSADDCCKIVSVINEIYVRFEIVKNSFAPKNWKNENFFLAGI